MARMTRMETRMRKLHDYISAHGNEEQQWKGSLYLGLTSQAVREWHDMLTGERNEAEHSHHDRRVLRKNTLVNLRKLRQTAEEIFREKQKQNVA